MKRNVAQVEFINGSLLGLDDPSRELHRSSAYGEKRAKGVVQFSPYEALFLVEKERMIVQQKDKSLDSQDLLKKFARQNKDFLVNYTIYADLRSKGYTVKTALKFGGDFRVYDKGIKPGEDHAKWVVYPTKESKSFRWNEFTAKNRVAHSTRKNLLLGVVDDDLAVSYFEIQWLKL